MKEPIHMNAFPQAIKTCMQATRRGDGAYSCGRIAFDSARMQFAVKNEAQSYRVSQSLHAAAAAADAGRDHARRLCVDLTEISHFTRIKEITSIYFMQPYPAMRRPESPRCRAAP